MSDPRDVSVYHLVFRLVSALVNRQDDVFLQSVPNNEGMTFSVRVHYDDLELLLGEQGRNAEAIRILMQSAGTKLNRRYDLIIEGEHALPAEPANPIVSQ